MSKDQSAVYKLCHKLNKLDEEERRELKRFSNPEVLRHSSEYYDYFATMRLGVNIKFQKKRQRAIWWYQHSFDVVAICVILAAVLVGFVYFVM